MLNIAILISRYRITLISCLIILILSFIKIPDATAESIINLNGFDSLVHYLLYFAVSFILLYEKNNKINQTTLKFITLLKFIPLIVIVLVGGLIEFIQPLVSPRTTEIDDFIANILGILTGIISYYFFHLKFKVRLNNG